VKSNDLKKGHKIAMSNGFTGEIMDNKKGNLRLAKIFGYATDIGSVYVWDITYPVLELTPAQIKARDTVKAMGF